jgi:hypothetical protein
MAKVFDLQELDKTKLPGEFSKVHQSDDFYQNEVPVEITNPQLKYKYGLLIFNEQSPAGLKYFEDDSLVFTYIEHNEYKDDTVVTNTFNLKKIVRGGGKRKRKSRRVKKSKRRNGRKSRKH